MIIGKVIGNVWSTHKESSMENLKLLIVQPLHWNKEPYGTTEVAIDRIGAGVGETILMTRGSSARQICDRTDIPVDAAVVSIVDSLEVNE